MAFWEVVKEKENYILRTCQARESPECLRCAICVMYRVHASYTSTELVRLCRPCFEHMRHVALTRNMPRVVEAMKGLLIKDMAELVSLYADTPVLYSPYIHKLIWAK